MPEFRRVLLDRKSTRLNSSHTLISYAVFCLKKKKPRTRQKPRGATQAPLTAPRCAALRSTRKRRVSRHRHSLLHLGARISFFFFFFNDTGTPEIYPLSLPAAFPI